MNQDTTTLRERLDVLRDMGALRDVGAMRRMRRGMTLMEIMIVIAIILLLMGALTFGLAGIFGDAQRSTAELSISRINEKVKIYQVKKKKLPESITELYAGEAEPKDPWGNPFKMKKGGKGGYDIISMGADGKEGGAGGDADVKLSELE